MTGGNTGIGKAITLSLARLKANIVIDYVAEEHATEELEHGSFHPLRAMTRTERRGMIS